MAEDTDVLPNLPETGLLLIGMGPGTVAGMTLEAIQAAKQATHRRYEAYTALWPESELDLLEQRIGSIQRVMRPEVEQPDELFALAKTSLVALLVVGDPLQATTHVDLQLQAIEHDIECRVYHGVSITTIVTGAVGLSNYRFGRQTTLTYPYGGWIATSPLEMIAVNKARGLHSLVLFDLDPTGQGTGEQRPMKPRDAKHSLELMWNKLDEHLNQFEKDVMNLKEVAECYCVSGHSDFLLKIVVTDMDEYREFILHKLASIKNIGNAQSHFVMNEIENEHFMPWISNSLTN